MLSHTPLNLMHLIFSDGLCRIRTCAKPDMSRPPYPTELKAQKERPAIFQAGAQ